MEDWAVLNRFLITAVLVAGTLVAFVIVPSYLLR